MCNADGCWPATNSDQRLGRGLGHDNAEPGQGKAVVVPPPNVARGALVRLSVHRLFFIVVGGHTMIPVWKAGIIDAVEMI